MLHEASLAELYLANFGARTRVEIHANLADDAEFESHSIFVENLLQRASVTCAGEEGSCIFFAIYLNPIPIKLQSSFFSSLPRFSIASNIESTSCKEGKSQTPLKRQSECISSVLDLILLILPTFFQPLTETPLMASLSRPSLVTMQGVGWL